MGNRNYTGEHNSCHRHGYATGLKTGNKISPTYRVWLKMRERCISPNAVGYKDYGGRGIKICERWLGKDGFSSFLLDMGERPSHKHSLDRINNEGNYEANNCRWATRTEQNRNSRNNINITYDGFTMCITAWAEYFGIRKGTFESSIRRNDIATAFQRGIKKRQERIKGIMNGEV